jgi:hypothetical protein
MSGAKVFNGRIMKAAAVPVGMSWMWTLAFAYHEDRTPTHGYAATPEAAMAAFAKSWSAANRMASAWCLSQPPLRRHRVDHLEILLPSGHAVKRHYTIEVKAVESVSSVPNPTSAN